MGFTGFYRVLLDFIGFYWDYCPVSFLKLLLGSWPCNMNTVINFLDNLIK